MRDGKREREEREREREVRFAIPTTGCIGMAIANITIQTEGRSHSILSLDMDVSMFTIHGERKG